MLHNVGQNVQHCCVCVKAGTGHVLGIQSAREAAYLSLCKGSSLLTHIPRAPRVSPTLSTPEPVSASSLQVCCCHTRDSVWLASSLPSPPQVRPNPQRYPLSCASDFPEGRN